MVPAEYEEVVSITREALPMPEVTPIAGFAGFVMNFQPATLAHRDRRDGGLCVVVASGNFSGGGIMPVQAGFDF